MQMFRRHAIKCKFTHRTEKRCDCVIWVEGRDLDGRDVRKALHIVVGHPQKLRDWTLGQELLRKYEVDGHRNEKPSRITIEEWRDRCINDITSRNLSASTKRKYKLLFAQLEEFAKIRGIVYADKITLDDLRQWRATWKDGPLSSAKKLERLRSIYKFALESRWVAENIAQKLAKPKVALEPTLPFTEDEMKKIFKAATESKRYAADATLAFILVMRYSGLRISDTTVLARESVTDRRLHLRMAKTKQSVSITIPDFVASALRKLESNNPQYFFWSGKSKSEAAVSLWRKRLAKVFEDSKIEDGHSHRFRDTFAVALLEAGVPIDTVSTLLGHQNIRITERHYSPWVKSRQDAMDKILERVQITAPV